MVVFLSCLGAWGFDKLNPTLHFSQENPSWLLICEGRKMQFLPHRILMRIK